MTIIDLRLIVLLVVLLCASYFVTQLGKMTNLRALFAYGVGIVLAICLGKIANGSLILAPITLWGSVLPSLLFALCAVYVSIVMIVPDLDRDEMIDDDMLIEHRSVL